MPTNIIENTGSEYNQYNETDIIRINTGQYKGMKGEAGYLLDTYNPSNLIRKSVTLQPDEKVLKWEGSWPNVTPVIIPIDWIAEKCPIRVTIRAKKIKGSKSFKDFAFNKTKEPVWKDGKMYETAYFEFVRIDNDFELKSGVISNTDTDLVVEQIGTDFVIREIDEDQCIAKPLT